ncbi:hypothetical protein SHKM778_22240 [Streptomyces sp. KM77-8]|uniref:EccD-like transmembrane domain-containing protein n=1 Tax=Streptomyces haneummycinicus TaxID=3074435 RepID=A0AAT9HEP1_9ACTN
MWGRLLALAVGLAMLIRARLFRYTSQVVCALVAGLGAVAALLLGLVLNPPPEALTEFVLHGDRGALDVRTVWLSAAVVAGTVLITAIGLVVPRKGSPLLGPPPRPRRVGRPAHPGAAVPGGAGRPHRRTGHDRLRRAVDGRWPTHWYPG